MCRLLAVITPKEQELSLTLGTSLQSFRSLSQVHCDGWGLAYWDSHNELVCHKRPESALHSANFDEAVNGAHTDAALLHIRKASPQMSNEVVNTHPFVSGSVAFAHNGWLYPQQPLEDLAHAAHAPAPMGDTDSELFFDLILAHLRNSEPVAALHAAIDSIRQSQVDYLSLNCMLLTDDSLYAVECWDPAAVERKGDPVDTFALRYLVQDDQALVASSGWDHDQSGWNTLGNGHVLQLHRGDLRSTIHRDLLQDGHQG